MRVLGLGSNGPAEHRVAAQPYDVAVHDDILENARNLLFPRCGSLDAFYRAHCDALPYCHHRTLVLFWVGLTRCALPTSLHGPFTCGNITPP